MSLDCIAPAQALVLEPSPPAVIEDSLQHVADLRRNDVDYGTSIQSMKRINSHIHQEESQEGVWH